MMLLPKVEAGCAERGRGQNVGPLLRGVNGAASHGCGCRGTGRSWKRNLKVACRAWIGDPAGSQEVAIVTDRIEKLIELNAPIERVWHALTDHIEFGQWFRVKLDGPFAPGRVASGHITYPGYEHLKWEATVRQMRAPHLFSFAWHPYAVDPAVDYSGEPTTLVEFRLAALPHGTRLSIVESGFDALPPHRRMDALRMNDSGWDQQTRNIRDHVER
jgi:uncharacterized protein YndB with AHSA1/START domain